MALSKEVSNLDFSTDRPNRDFRIVPESFKKPVRINTMHSTDVPHVWTASFDCHFDERLVIF